MRDLDQLDLFSENNAAKDFPLYECFICGEHHLGECDIEKIKKSIESDVDTP